MLSPEQKAARRLGIGGSDIGVVVGVDPFRTRLDLYLDKAEGFEQAETEAMERGRFFEPAIAAWHAHRHGVMVWEPGPYRHPGRPIARCTPDRFWGPQADPAFRRTGRLLSIKAPGPRARDEFGEDGTDEVPLSYLLQLQWEMLCVGATGLDGLLVDFALLSAVVDGDLRTYRIEGDAELQGMLLEEAERFWRDHIEPRRPPPLDGSVGAAAWLRRRFPANRKPLREATMEEEVLALQLREAEGAEALAQGEADRLRNLAREAIGDADGIKGAFGAVTWRADKNGKRTLRTKWRERNG